MVSSRVNEEGLAKTTFGWWLPSKIWRDSVGMQNIPLRLLRCWEGLFGAVKDSWDWHGREELEAGEES